MIIIYPPAAKISEPPPGAALLSGALKDNGVECTVIDANLDGMLWLAGKERDSKDRWTGRAINHLDRNIEDLKKIETYRNWARYRQRVMDLNRAISTACDGSRYGSRFRISLSDYSDDLLSPVKSDDLLRSAEEFRENPFFPFFELSLKERISGDSSCYIGISLCYLSQALTAFALAGWIKFSFPGKKIVMGGGLVTSWMSMPIWNDLSGNPTFTDSAFLDLSFNDPAFHDPAFQNFPFNGLIDIIVRGRGEERLTGLCLEEKGESPAPEKSYMPDFSDICWDRYIAPGRILPFRTAEGCYWNRCRFCPEKAEGNRYRAPKKEQLLDDLDLLVESVRPYAIHFMDDAVSPSFLGAFAARMTARINRSGMKPFHNDIEGRDKNCINRDCDGSSVKRYSDYRIGRFNSDRSDNILDRDLSSNHLPIWYGFVRFTKELTDPDFCRSLYLSGCRMLKLGLESGDQSVLKKMEKGTDLELASSALKTLKSAGIKTYVYLLFGTQFEDEAAAVRTMDYVARHSSSISYLNLAIFNLPRFSEDAGLLETESISPGDLSLYLNFSHPAGWDRKKVRKFLDTRFRKVPSIAAILKNDPPFFTSNHAIFMS